MPQSLPLKKKKRTKNTELQFNNPFQTLIYSLLFVFLKSFQNLPISHSPFLVYYILIDLASRTPSEKDFVTLKSLNSKHVKVLILTSQPLTMLSLASFRPEFRHRTYLWVFFSHLHSHFIFLHPAIKPCLSLSCLSTLPLVAYFIPAHCLNYWTLFSRMVLCVRTCVHVSCVHMCVYIGTYINSKHANVQAGN